MGLIDFIKNLFGNGKQDVKIIVQDLTKIYKDPTPLEIGLYTDKTPITNTPIDITINGVTYTKTTDNNGIATLNINLNVGEYTTTIKYNGDDTYNSTTAYATVLIRGNTRMEGIDINKTVSQKATYQCAVYNQDNQRVTGDVDITVNGVTYTKKIELDGLARLNINLGQGNYTITSTFKGSLYYNSSSVTNTITVNPDPAPPTPTPAPTPQKSRSEQILDEFEKYFGRCEYIDDALAKIRNKGYAFYFSDGYNMYDTIKRIANGQGANCYDSAEVFYHLALGMNTKYGRNYDVQYLHVWCPVSGYDHIRLRLRTNGGSWFYRDPASVLDGGSVESNWCGTSDNILEVNPSFIIDG